MTRRADVSSSELPPTVRTRVRLPDALASARIFQGWGPGLSGR
jgi:hypothetical protein